MPIHPHIVPSILLRVFLCAALLPLSCRAKVESIKKHHGIGQSPESSSENDDAPGTESKSKSKAKKDAESSSTTSQTASSQNQPNNQTSGETPPPVFTASNTPVHDLVIGTEIAVTLPYNSNQGFSAASCSVSNLVRLSVVTPCACSSGICEVTLTNTSNQLGNVSFAFTLTDVAGAASSAQGNIAIVPDISDSTSGTKGFEEAVALNNLTLEAGGLRVSTATADFRELQYDEGSNTYTETSFFPTSLTRYWRLNGDAGTPVPTAANAILDFSGNSADGTFVDGNGSADTNFSSAWLNQGIPLDGFDYLDLPIPNTALQTDTGILSLWFKSDLPENPIQNHYLFEVYANSDNRLYCRYQQSTVVFECRCHGAGLNASIATSSDVLKEYEWNHLVLTWNRSADIFHLYINGKPLGSAPCDYQLPFFSDFYVGAPNSLSNERWIGEVDEIALWRTINILGMQQDLYLHQRADYIIHDPVELTSRVLDSGAENTVWSKVSWQASAAPHNKELPQGRQTGNPQYNGSNTESAYDQHNADINFMNEISGYYRFNGSGSLAQGQEITDYSGNNFHGVSYNSGTAHSYVDGKFNQALRFPSLNHVILNSNLRYNQWHSTISFWFSKTGNPSGTYGCMVSSKSMTSNDHFAQICVNNGYSIAASFGQCSGTPAPFQKFWGGNILYGIWHHAALTSQYVEGEGIHVAFYVDGLLAGKSILDPANLCDEDGTIALGFREGSNDYYFQGDMDELAIWNRALSANEILGLYRRGNINLKLQVSSCSDISCSDVSFVGPTGSTSTYYTEVLSNDHGFPVINIEPPIQSRYLQYKVIFENRDPFLRQKLDKVQFFLE